MNGVIKCPPGTFGCMGVEKMHFQQPALFPSAYLNTTLKVTETPFPDNVPDTGMVFLTYSQTASLTASSFQSNFVFNGISYPVALANIRYDGSGGYVLASYLDCILQTMNNWTTSFFRHSYQFNSAYMTLDFKCSLFSSWNTLSNVSSTSSSVSKVDMANAWLRTNCPPLFLFFN